MSETRDQKNELLRQVAEHMPDWACYTMPDMDFDNVTLQFQGNVPLDPEPGSPGGSFPNLWCNMSRNGRESGPYKMHFSGSFPRDKHRYMDARDWNVVPYDAPEGVRRPSASVSSSRKPEAIARDITKRVAAPYLELWSKCVAKKIERIAYGKNQELLIRRLAAVLGAVPDGKSTTDRQDDIINSFSLSSQVASLKDQCTSVEAEVHGNQVTLTLRVSELDAKAVLGVLKLRFSE